MNPCGFVYCWSETKALESMQKALSIFTSFVTEEVYVGISHSEINLPEVENLSRVSSK